MSQIILVPRAAIFLATAKDWYIVALATAVGPNLEVCDLQTLCFLLQMLDNNNDNSYQWLQV